MKLQLRFKEFTDEWEEKKLGEIFQYQKEKINIDYDFDKYVSTENLLSDFRGVKFPNYSNENKATKFQQNDILMGNIRPYLNKIWLANCDGGASNDVNVFKVFDLYDVQFVYYLVANERFTNKVMLTATGTKMPRGDKKAILEFQYHIPSLLEQEKIGKFFSLIDQRIERQERKVALLKEEKKGYMQKLFKQELRFKDEQGNNYPEWEERRLDSVIRERKEYGYRTNYELVSFTIEDGVTSKTDRFNREFLVREKNKKYKITYLDDLVYNPANLKFGAISLNKYGTAIFSPIYITFEIVEGNTQYIGYYLTTQNFINKALKYQEGTVYERQSVKVDDFIRQKILFPSLDEQEKIAKFLSLLDQRIEKEQEKLRLMREEKKGLMQRMFV